MCVGFFASVVFFAQRMRLLKAKSKSPWTDDHVRVDDGGLRAAVFGFSDGVVSNVCLILGVYISIYNEATDSVAQTRSVVVSGLAGLLAGACSMACGEWISMVAQKQGLETELQLERTHLKKYKTEEQKLLKNVLVKHGMSEETAARVIKDISLQGPEKMLPFHAQMVLGIDCEDLGSPIKSALSSFVCFAVGALTPVIPWIFMEDHYCAFKWTVILVSAAILAAGSIVSQFSHKGVLYVSMRQLAVVCVSVVFSMASSFVLIGSVV
eukprot:CAMPEP_0170178988 /NCGR_PEP_ID=MMETSP0040_2-20121228/15834_1 /TAXON_ID=641309 /ORGANISM="Lotharella oceanica, Strain CCMP622" /LENGTH=266 /DNA_ID=CAMNT_0010422745 /DNA_START=13 /DNA_END=813 /DNA_ORIENTATION=-